MPDEEGYSSNDEDEDKVNESNLAEPLQARYFDKSRAFVAPRCDEIPDPSTAVPLKKPPLSAPFGAFSLPTFSFK